MKTMIASVVGCLAFSLALQAQDICVIKGKIANDSLRYNERRITKVFLTQLDEFNRQIVVDSTKIKKGSFQFKHKLAQDAPSMLYQITGFDNGTIEFFVEPGTVHIQIDRASFPASAYVSGTTTNELYMHYKGIKQQCILEQLDSLHSMKGRGVDVKSMMNTPEGQQWWQRIGAAALVECDAKLIEFLLSHNDSPLAPLMMEKEIYKLLDKAYAQKLFDALSPTLKGHPYYRSYGNVVKSLDLQKGSEVPDITLPLSDGKVTHLSDYRGKFILLNFWSSDNAVSLNEMKDLVRLYEETKEKENFTLISFSMDDNYDNWQKGISTNGIARNGWIQASDLLGLKSPAARLMGVSAVPRTILIDPEGRAIAFDLRGNDLIRRVKRILSGDLYYQNEK